MDKNSYTLPQKHYKVQRKYSYNPVYILVFIFLIIIFLSICFFVLNNNRACIVLARYEQIVDGFETKGLLVRNEHIYRSPLSGKIFLKKGEGERVSYGQVVMQIGDVSLRNYHPGLISYALDGLEEVFKPELLGGLTTKDFKQIKRRYKQLVDGDYIGQGELAFRIIDNNSMFIVIQSEAREIERYRTGEVVFVQAHNLDRELIEGQVTYKRIDGNTGLMIISLDSFICEWLNLRWVEITFIKNIYRGIVIPRQAVFTGSEGEGVLIYNSDSSYTFKNVKVLNGNREKVVIDGLGIGEKVVENPAVLDYGRGV